MSDADRLLVVDDLSTTFATAVGAAARGRRTSRSTSTRNETLGIVGESGSGKTVLARTIMGLQPRANVDGHRFGRCSTATRWWA